MLNLMHLTAINIINILRMRCFKKDFTGPNPYVYILVYIAYKICNSK